MRIVLSMFNGRLKSKPMDVPENTSRIFKMVFTQRPTAIIEYGGKEIGKTSQFITICEFEYIGKLDGESGERIYELTDIIKQ